MAESPKKILVVEDEKPINKALELKLTHEQFAVTTAFDGEEGLAQVQQGQFDLILLDLVMPKKDGFQVLSELQAANNTTPIIVLSNLGQAEDIKRAKDFGAVDYFVKSQMSIVDIVNRVKEIAV
jgi:DNA-binding response OmpR family regulator